MTNKKPREPREPRARFKDLMTSHKPVDNPSAVGADKPSKLAGAVEPEVKVEQAQVVQPEPETVAAPAPQAVEPAQVVEPEAPATVVEQVAQQSAQVAEVAAQPEVVTSEVNAQVAPQPTQVVVQPQQVAEPAQVVQAQQPTSVQPQPAQEPTQVNNTPGSWQAAKPPFGGGVQKMSNVSVPLDPERYFNMSIARVHTGLTAKDILTEALDDWLIKKGFVQPPQQ